MISTGKIIHERQQSNANPGRQTDSGTMKYLIPVVLALVGATAQAAPDACPKAMSPTVEAKLLPVLQARDQSVRSKDWLDPKYESAIEALLQAQDSASREARVALMDYDVGDAYQQELICAVAFDGKRMIPVLERYSRCDIAPTQGNAPRDHAATLREQTLKMLKKGHIEENCNFD